jgi:hypothetical protein
MTALRNDAIEYISRLLVANAEVVIKVAIARAIILEKDVAFIVIKLIRRGNSLQLLQQSLTLSLQ